MIQPTIEPRQQVPRQPCCAFGSEVVGADVGSKSDADIGEAFSVQFGVPIYFWLPIHGHRWIAGGMDVHAPG